MDSPQQRSPLEIQLEEAKAQFLAGCIDRKDHRLQYQGQIFRFISGETPVRGMAGGYLGHAPSQGLRWGTDIYTCAECLTSIAIIGGTKIYPSDTIIREKGIVLMKKPDTIQH